MHFQYCEFNSALDNQPKQINCTWDDFVSRCQQFADLPLIRGREESLVAANPGACADIWTEAKKRQPCFSPVIYHTAHRAQKNVQSITAYCVDLDGCAEDVAVEVIDNLKQQGLHFCLWTTWGNGWKTDGVCLRIVVPFSNSVDFVSVDQWRLFWGECNVQIANCINDQSTKDASRLHFFPGAPSIVGTEARGQFNNEQPYFEVHQGSRFYDPQPIIEIITERIEEEKPKAIIKQTNNLFKRGNDKRAWAEKYLQSICDKILPTQDGFKHAALRDAAFAAGGLLNHLDKSECRAALLSVCRQWQTQGKKVNIKADEKTIESGLLKGSATPIQPTEKPFTGNLNGLFMSDAEVDALDKKPIEEEFDIDKEYESLWQQFKEFAGVPALFAKDIEQRADYWQPGLFLGAGIALCCAIAMRRFCFDGLTTSQFCLSIARTGEGKGAPQNLLSDALSRGFTSLLAAGDFSSSASFIDRLQGATNADHGLCFCIDEYGPQLKTLLNDKAIAKLDMRQLFLRIATIGTGDLRCSTPKASGGQDRVITAPGLVLLGSSTPAALLDAVQTSSIADGFLGRHLWFCGKEDFPMRCQNPLRLPASEQLVDEIAHHKEAWLKWQASLPPDQDKKTQDGRQVLFYRPDVVSQTARAVEECSIVTTWVDQQRQSASDTERALLARVIEQGKRVALAIAVAKSKGAIPTITLVDLDFGFRLAFTSAQSALQTIKKHKTNIKEKKEETATPPKDYFADRCDKVISILTEDPTITYRDLLRKTKSKAKDLEEVRQWIQDSGTLIDIPQSKGKAWARKDN